MSMRTRILVWRLDDLDNSEAINVVDVATPPATGVGFAFGAAVPA